MYGESSILILATGATIAVLTVALLRSYTVAGWVLIGVLSVLATDTPPLVIGYIAGIQINVSDAACAALLGAALGRRQQLREALRPYLAPVVILGGCLGFSIFRGIVDYGAGAFVEFRPIFYALCALLWSASIDWRNERERRRFVGFVTVVGLALALKVVLGISANGLATSSDFYVDEVGNYRTLRPVIASQAMVLGAVFLISWSYRPRLQHPALLAVAASTSAGALLVAQHRSVWAATVAGLAVLVLMYGGDQRVRMFVGGLAAVAVAVGLAAASGHLVEIQDSVRKSFDAITGHGSTLTDRSVGWSQLVSDVVSKGPSAIAGGLPFGSGYLRIGPTGLIETYSPHNFYVQLFLRSGLLGLGAWVSILGVAVARGIRQKAVTQTAVLVSVGVFCLAYGLEWYPAVFMGWAMASTGRAAPLAIESAAPFDQNATAHSRP